MKRNSKLRKILSLVLVVTFMLAIPMTVSAEGNEQTDIPLLVDEADSTIPPTFDDELTNGEIVPLASSEPYTTTASVSAASNLTGSYRQYDRPNMSVSLKPTYFTHTTSELPRKVRIAVIEKTLFGTSDLGVDTIDIPKLNTTYGTTIAGVEKGSRAIRFSTMSSTGVSYSGFDADPVIFNSIN